MEEADPVGPLGLESEQRPARAEERVRVLARLEAPWMAWEAYLQEAYPWERQQAAFLRAVDLGAPLPACWVNPWVAGCRVRMARARC